MLKSLDNDSNLYLRIERIENAILALRELNEHGSFLTSNLKDPHSFFGELHDFCNRYKKSNRQSRRDIEAIQLEIMLPQDIDHDRILMFVTTYAIKALQTLPYTAYLIKRGNGLYVHYLISERRYTKKSTKVNICAKSDVFQKINDKGKKVFTNATDPAAICIHKKGAIYKSYSTHFTNKNRIFTGNDNEFSHKLKNLRRIALSLFTKIHFVIKRVFIRKINIKEANGNYYRYMNIRDLNDTFLYFENKLNEAENRILLGYMEDELSNLYSVKYKYLNRIREFRFHYGRISLPFHFCMRRDMFCQNLETLIKTFDNDLTNFYDHFTENYSKCN